MYTLSEYDVWFSHESQYIVGYFSTYENAVSAMEDRYFKFSICSNGKDQWNIENEKEECTECSVWIKEIKVDDFESIGVCYG